MGGPERRCQAAGAGLLQLLLRRGRKKSHSQAASRPGGSKPSSSGHAGARLRHQPGEPTQRSRTFSKVGCGTPSCQGVWKKGNRKKRLRWNPPAVPLRVQKKQRGARPTRSQPGEVVPPVKAEPAPEQAPDDTTEVVVLDGPEPEAERGTGSDMPAKVYQWPVVASGEPIRLSTNRVISSSNKGQRGDELFLDEYPGCQGLPLLGIGGSRATYQAPGASDLVWKLTTPEENRARGQGMAWSSCSGSTFRASSRQGRGWLEMGFWPSTSGGMFE